MSKTKSKKASIPAKAAKPAKVAKTIYRLCVADEGRQPIGECGSADEATKKARAFQKKHAVPVGIARGKVVGSEFVSEFTEVVQPAGTDPKPSEPVASPTIAAEPATTTEVPTTEPSTTNETQPTTKAPRAKKATKPEKTAKLSALDAAAQVLKKAGTPMSTPEMIERMAAQKLWESPNGKTPAATLYSAILREINVKAAEARFKKTNRGRFEFACN